VNAPHSNTGGYLGWHASGQAEAGGLGPPLFEPPRRNLPASLARRHGLMPHGGFNAHSNVVAFGLIFYPQCTPSSLHRRLLTRLPSLGDRGQIHPIAPGFGLSVGFDCIVSWRRCTRLQARE